MVHPYIAYTLWGCAAGQGMVYYLLSVAKGIWFRESLSTGYFLQDWFDLLDEFCLFSKYTKVMTVTYRALLQLPINGRGVICELLLNFTVDTTHRFCFYAVKSSKPSFDQLINLVIWYPMLGNTAEGNDCGPITARHFVPRLESDAFQKMRRLSCDVLPTEH